MTAGARTRTFGRAWTPEEDRKLLLHVAAHGTRQWRAVVNAGLLPGRDSKACCNRFIVLKRKYFNFRERLQGQFHPLLGFSEDVFPLQKTGEDGSDNGSIEAALADLANNIGTAVCAAPESDKGIIFTEYAAPAPAIEAAAASESALTEYGSPGVSTGSNAIATQAAPADTNASAADGGNPTSAAAAAPAAAWVAKEAGVINLLPVPPHEPVHELTGGHLRGAPGARAAPAAVSAAAPAPAPAAVSAAAPAPAPSASAAAPALTPSASAAAPALAPSASAAAAAAAAAAVFPGREAARETRALNVPPTPKLHGTEHWRFRTESVYQAVPDLQHRHFEESNAGSFLEAALLNLLSRMPAAPACIQPNSLPLSPWVSADPAMPVEPTKAICEGRSSSSFDSGANELALKECSGLQGLRNPLSGEQGAGSALEFPATFPVLDDSETVGEWLASLDYRAQRGRHAHAPSQPRQTWVNGGCNRLPADQQQAPSGSGLNGAGVEDLLESPCSQGGQSQPRQTWVNGGCNRLPADQQQAPSGSGLHGAGVEGLLERLCSQVGPGSGSPCRMRPDSIFEAMASGSWSLQ